ncbi:Spo0E family sporulation regulatory protein-aspartic acid phosphatase [Clostridium rectalis]|uniref:Spo0E family sporulation regulatory protein-aspartic acid phosphatase n=1 Tax=Clostridium rectalis TaxID=2040295 RepID=UPI000F638B38|nr:Spo0E family sporulation regulatory protein-aspartic acid phosphatase [Clostridium rectalis]
MCRNLMSSYIDINEMDVLVEKQIGNNDGLLDIEKEIECTRQLLNEVTCDIDDREKSEQILKVSQYMDKLLNEYTSIISNK